MWALNGTVDEGVCDVIISTAKAKGREWPTVRLMDDFMNRQPRGRSDRNEREKTNGNDPAELRLFYVAFTRAREVIEVPSSILWLVNGASYSQYPLEPVSPTPRPKSETPVPSGNTASKTEISRADKEIAVSGQVKDTAWSPPTNWRPESKPIQPGRQLPTECEDRAPAIRKGFFDWLLGR